MKYIFAIVIGLVLSAQAAAWQGYNLDTGTVIMVNTEGRQDITTGNVVYFDYDTGLEKIGYLNMYEQNIGLLVDLDSGELIRVKMEGR
ncbi:MAG: hypothetical protein R8G33_02400 [Gammaproteobacteria bacterium]|nr:hypothetical protein [Gammaproteobacteria bacterium]